MHRQLVRKLLNSYAEIWLSGTISYPSFRPAEERAIWQKFCSFVEDEPQCFERTCRFGHITGSALVISQDWSQVLLLLHRKLDKWLQLGGHSDGDSHTAAVALREAQEESGLQHLDAIAWHQALLPQSLGQAGELPELVPFDLDIHLIPARKDEPEHFHFDIRFLFQANSCDRLVRSEQEAKALRWVDLDSAEELTQERSMIRQFEKVKAVHYNISKPHE